MDKWGGVHTSRGAHKSLLGSYTPVPWWKDFVITPDGDVLGLLRWGTVDRLSDGARLVKGFLGRNTAVDLELVNGGQAVLDEMGLVYTFNGAPAPGRLPYFGWEIARDLEYVPSTGAYYVLSGYGTLHTDDPAGPFKTVNFGWDIARGMAFLADGSGGYVLDGFGGVTPFGSAEEIVTPYFGWDVAVDIELTPEGDGLFILDAFGGVHSCGNAPLIESLGFSADVAVDLEILDRQ